VKVSRSRVRDGLAIIAEDAGAFIGGTFSEQRGQIPAQVITPPPRELIQQPRRPVRLPPRVVHLVRVVEKSPYRAHVVAFERAIELRQIMPDRAGGKMIYDVALAPRCRPLHHLAVPSLKNGVDGPLAFGCGPVELALWVDSGGEIDRLPARREGHQRDQGHGFRKLYLVQREPLQVLVSRDWFHEVRFLDLTRVSAELRLLRRTDQPLARDPQNVAIELIDLVAHHANQWLLCHHYVLGKTLAALQLPRSDRNVPACVVRVDPRPAERPPCAGRQVDAEIEPSGLPERVPQQRQPSLRQVRNELLFIAGDAVDRSNFERIGEIGCLIS
jgi:hypothetical protein